MIRRCRNTEMKKLCLLVNEGHSFQPGPDFWSGLTSMSRVVSFRFLLLCYIPCSSRHGQFCELVEWRCFSGNLAVMLGKCISHSLAHSPQIVVRTISYKLGVYSLGLGGRESILANVCWRQWLKSRAVEVLLLLSKCMLIFWSSFKSA